MPREKSQPGGTGMLLLSLLSRREMYGYEMIAALEARSDHTFTLKEGTLYPVLHQLEKEGAVTCYEKQAPTGRVRKYYHITRKGLRLLGEKREEWRQFSRLVDAITASGRAALEAQREQWNAYAAGVRGVLEGGVTCGA